MQTKFTPDKLVKLERKLIQTFKKYNTINYRGCGLFSLELSKRLPGSEIVVSAYKFPEYCNHARVRFEGYDWDSEGRFPISYSFNPVKREQMEKRCEDPDKWNDTFNRSEFPKIKIKLEKLFSKL